MSANYFGAEETDAGNYWSAIAVSAKDRGRKKLNTFGREPGIALFPSAMGAGQIEHVIVSISVIAIR